MQSCTLHAGDYQRALHLYETLAATSDSQQDPFATVYTAACHFYLGKYEEAEQIASAAPPCALANRILLHCAHASGDEEKLVERHGLMSKTELEDQLSLAAIHFRRSHFQVRRDVLHTDWLATYTFLAMCSSGLVFDRQDSPAFVESSGDGACRLRRTCRRRLTSTRRCCWSTRTLLPSTSSLHSATVGVQPPHHQHSALCTILVHQFSLC